MALRHLHQTPTRFLSSLARRGRKNIPSLCVCGRSFRCLGKGCCWSAPIRLPSRRMLDVALADKPTLITRAPGLFAMNIDPETALTHTVLASSTRWTLLLPTMSARRCKSNCQAPAPPRSQPSMSSSACLLATRRTSTTLSSTPRRRDIRSAFSAYEGVDGIFSPAMIVALRCLGPHSGLKMREETFRKGLEALGDRSLTTNRSRHASR